LIDLHFALVTATVNQAWTKMHPELLISASGLSKRIGGHRARRHLTWRLFTGKRLARRALDLRNMLNAGMQ
jgi:hypothetical protein